MLALLLGPLAFAHIFLLEFGFLFTLKLSSFLLGLWDVFVLIYAVARSEWHLIGICEVITYLEILTAYQVHFAPIEVLCAVSTLIGSISVMRL